MFGRLTQAEKMFLGRALILAIADAPGTHAIPALAISAEIADKLGCTEELRGAACLFEAEKPKPAVS